MTPAQVDVAVLSISGAADLASTRYALAHCTGCREGNPLMTEPAVAILAKTAAVVVVAKGCGALRSHGHKRAAKVLRWTVAGVWLGLAANNLKVSR